MNQCIIVIIPDFRNLDRNKDLWKNLLKLVFSNYQIFFWLNKKNVGKSENIVGKNIVIKAKKKKMRKLEMMNQC